MAALEATWERTLPTLERVEKKLDKALDLIGEKASRGSVAEAHGEIDKIQLALKEKADKADVKAVDTKLDELRSRMLIWTGAGLVIMVLVSWYGQKLLTVLATK